MKDNKIVNIVGLLLVTALSFFIVFQVKDYVDAKANAVEGVSKDAVEEAMDVTGQKYVKSAVKYVNKDGAAEAFKVTTATEGFQSTVELEITFAADGKTVTGAAVVSQGETENFGADIEKPENLAKFEGVVAPLDSFDLISGATFTSEAAMLGVNKASEFIQVAEFGAVVEEEPTEPPVEVVDPMDGITGEEEAMDVTGYDIVKSAVKYVKDGAVEAFKVTVAPNGFGGPIEMELVFEADGTTVKGVTILSQNETANFGGKIEAPENLAKFAGVVSPVESFDLIAGATITSEAARFGIDTASAMIQNVEFGASVEVREPDMVAGATE